MIANPFNPKTRQELARAYAINRRTFLRWLKRENITLPKGLVKRNDLDRIYKAFGMPECFERKSRNSDS